MASVIGGSSRVSLGVSRIAPVRSAYLEDLATEQKFLKLFIQRNKILSLINKKNESENRVIDPFNTNSRIMIVLNDIFEDKTLLDILAQRLIDGGFRGRRFTEERRNNTLTIEDIIIEYNRREPNLWTLFSMLRSIFDDIIPNGNRYLRNFLVMNESIDRIIGQIRRVSRDRTHPVLLNVTHETKEIVDCLKATFDTSEWVKFLCEYLKQIDGTFDRSDYVLFMGRSEVKMEDLISLYNERNSSLRNFSAALQNVLLDMTPIQHYNFFARDRTLNSVSTQENARSDANRPITLTYAKAIDRLSMFCDGNLYGQDHNNRMINDVKRISEEIESYIQESDNPNTTLMDLIEANNLTLPVPYEDLEDIIASDMLKIPVLCFCRDGGQTVNDAFSLKGWIESSGSVADPKTRQPYVHLELNVILLGRILSLIQKLHSKLFHKPHNIYDEHGSEALGNISNRCLDTDGQATDSSSQEHPLDSESIELLIEEMVNFIDRKIRKSPVNRDVKICLIKAFDTDEKVRLLGNELVSIETITKDQLEQIFDQRRSIPILKLLTTYITNPINNKNLEGFLQAILNISKK